MRRYLRLARRAARQYTGPREPFDHLFQVACPDLVHAVDRFDPRREISFGSYPGATIRGELKRQFRDRARAMRVRDEARPEEVKPRRRAKVRDALDEGWSRPRIAAEMLSTGTSDRSRGGEG